MYLMSWHKNPYHLNRIVCEDEKTVLTIADMLEAQGQYFKVSDMSGMLSAKDFQGDCKDYKYWLDAK